MNSPRFFLLAIALLLFCHVGNSQGNKLHPETIPGSGIDIEITRPFSQIQADGYMPFQVEITNQSGKTRAWNFATHSSAGYSDGRKMRSDTILTVPHGETRIFDVLAPISRIGAHSYGEVTVQVSGFGVQPKRLSLGGGFRSGSMRAYMAAVAMSQELASRNWGELQSQRPDLSGSTFDLKTIPTDWRAFSGFDQVWLSANEWRQADHAKRIALLDWVATGGALYVGRESDDTIPLTGLGALAAGKPLPHGLGKIHQQPTEQNALDIESTIQQMDLTSPTDPRLGGGVPRLLDYEYGRDTWPLLAKIGTVKLRQGLFIGFLLLFGIIIGPVNLFVFARGNRRYRLFWTTPALSLGASALIFLLILFQDGLGGSGHRLAVWSYLPDENKAVLLQEQVSRTALLTDRSFVSSSPAFISAVETGSVPSIDSGTFRIRGQNYAGDWFRNRAVQGHVIKTVTSTRSRIEITANSGQAPTALSTFPFPLETLYYLDENGFWWRGENLRSGESHRLKRTEEAAFADSRKAIIDEAGAVIKKQVLDLSTERGHFFAFANDPAATFQTLSSIDWKTSPSLHTGPVVQESRR